MPVKRGEKPSGTATAYEIGHEGGFLQTNDDINRDHHGSLVI